MVKPFSRLFHIDFGFFRLFALFVFSLSSYSYTVAAIIAKAFLNPRHCRGFSIYKKIPEAKAPGKFIKRSAPANSAGADFMPDKN